MSDGLLLSSGVSPITCVRLLFFSEQALLTRCDRQHNTEYLLALLGTLGSLRGFDDEALRFLGAGPAHDLYPLPGLKIFIVLEEVLDLLEGDLGQISIRLDPIVPGGEKLHLHEGGELSR